MQGQREHAAIARENCGRAVAVMNVAIDDQRFFDGAFVLQRADGDGDIVNRAKAFAVRPETRDEILRRC